MSWYTSRYSGSRSSHDGPGAPGRISSSQAASASKAVRPGGSRSPAGAASRSPGWPPAMAPVSGWLAMHHRHVALFGQLGHDLGHGLAGHARRLVHEVPERQGLVLADPVPEPDRHHGPLDVLVRGDQQVELAGHLDRAPLGVLAGGRDLLDVAELGLPRGDPRAA